MTAQPLQSSRHTERLRRALSTVDRRAVKIAVHKLTIAARRERSLNLKQRNRRQAKCTR